MVLSRFSTLFLWPHPSFDSFSIRSHSQFSGGESWSTSCFRGPSVKAPNSCYLVRAECFPHYSIIYTPCDGKSASNRRLWAKPEAKCAKIRNKGKKMMCWKWRKHNERRKMRQRQTWSNNMKLMMLLGRLTLGERESREAGRTDGVIKRESGRKRRKAAEMERWLPHLCGFSSQSLIFTYDNPRSRKRATTAHMKRQ